MTHDIIVSSSVAKGSVRRHEGTIIDFEEVAPEGWLAGATKEINLSSWPFDYPSSSRSVDAIRAFWADRLVMLYAASPRAKPRRIATLANLRPLRPHDKVSVAEQDAQLLAQW